MPYRVSSPHELLYIDRHRPFHAKSLSQRIFRLIARGSVTLLPLLLLWRRHFVFVAGHLMYLAVVVKLIVTGGIDGKSEQSWNATGRNSRGGRQVLLEISAERALARVFVALNKLCNANQNNKVRTRLITFSHIDHGSTSRLLK